MRAFIAWEDIIIGLLVIMLIMSSLNYDKRINRIEEKLDKVIEHLNITHE